MKKQRCRFIASQRLPAAHGHPVDIPTIGLFISSFRNAVDIATSGWWKVFPHREWEVVVESDPKVLGLDPNSVMTVEGVTGTFDELREGIESPDGDTRVTWVGNKRLGKIQVQKQVWTVSWDFTLDNYKYVLSTDSFVVTRADGSTDIIPGQGLSQAFLNSLAVAIPSTIIPILIAAFAAYAFAWMTFPGRKLLFIMIIGLLVVPRRLPWCPSAGLQQPGIERHFPGGVAGAYRLWPGAGDLSVVQLCQHLAARDI
jgi:alpha-glucoside transport system permease protein